MNRQFSTIPLLSVTERNASMDNYFFNRFIRKFPYRKPFEKKKKNKKVRKRSNSVILNENKLPTILEETYQRKRSNSVIMEKELSKKIQLYEKKIKNLKKTYIPLNKWKL